ncbi:NAD(P)/FAD-dependent oxidoreductase [Pedobacter nyackensis]|uniref:NAD(P)/FAD-dependent oxidoreductase n=1 Tax=Pedobacter nyackensis TaxID=475255 RepID=UPI00293143AC|nr:NAD(P)/FAD-dependent oxidoreductase [Pedobacter nyackensis]
MKQKVVIVGAGFAGLELANSIDGRIFEVLLLDKLNHHQFQPLFYQVATAQIEPSSISFPLRYVFKNKEHVQIRLAEVIKINQEGKSITTSAGDFDYDFLVIAIGCKTNFFGNENIEKNALTLKSTSDAIKVRNHILQTFEVIANTSWLTHKDLLNLVIVGGGPTGVELAGAFAEIKQNILPVDYPGIDFTDFKVTLVEGSGHTLNNMSEKSKKASENYLRNMGVEILKETFVKNYDGKELSLSNGKTIRTKSVIWAAGVTGNALEGIQQDCKTVGNRIKVDRTNSLIGCNGIYAIGDISYMETEKYPRGHPQIANVAINQAKNLAKNLKRLHAGKSALPYEYKDLGSMATIGKNKAVVDVNSLHLSGYFAWLIWMFLHLFLILGVKNKLIIFINWAWNYLTKNPSLRLILNQPLEKTKSLDNTIRFSN